VSLQQSEAWRFVGQTNRLWLAICYCFPVTWFALTRLSPRRALCSLAGLGFVAALSGCSGPVILDDGTGGTVWHNTTICGGLGGAGSEGPVGAAPRVDIGLLDEAGHLTRLGPGVEGRLQYGNQVGMGLGMAAYLGAGDVGQAKRVELHMSVDGADLGVWAGTAPFPPCDLSAPSYLKVMLMVDVIGHPTVRSVAQLDHRSVNINWIVYDDFMYVIQQGQTEVILRL
jgi:hypothetical protein